MPKPVVQGVVRRLVVLIARCAGVVRKPVLLSARCGQPNRVLSVVPCKARYAGRDPRWAWYRPNARHAGVIPCRCGRHMLLVRERRMPERRTRPCSRPLRARDRWFFDGFCGALAAADGQAVGRLGSVINNPFLMVTSR